jgi:hypothetical protein
MQAFRCLVSCLVRLRHGCLLMTPKQGLAGRMLRGKHKTCCFVVLAGRLGDTPCVAHVLQPGLTCRPLKPSPLSAASNATLLTLAGRLSRHKAVVAPLASPCSSCCCCCCCCCCCTLRMAAAASDCPAGLRRFRSGSSASAAAAAAWRGEGSAPRGDSVAPPPFPLSSRLGMTKRLPPPLATALEAAGRSRKLPKRWRLLPCCLPVSLPATHQSSRQRQLSHLRHDQGMFHGGMRHTHTLPPCPANRTSAASSKHHIPQQPPTLW